MCELDGLQRALNGVEHLKGTPEQTPAINGIRCAALIRQYPLSEFQTKLKIMVHVSTLESPTGS